MAFATVLGCAALHAFGMNEDDLVLSASGGGSIAALQGPRLATAAHVAATAAAAAYLGEGGNYFSAPL